MGTESEFVGVLRDRVIEGLHRGDLRGGARIPGVRETAREHGVNPRTVAKAYRQLEREGLVEVRGRSGVFLAEQQRLGSELLPETAGWLAGVLVAAWKRSIRMADLPELMRRSTLSRRLRCAVVESNEEIGPFRLVPHSPCISAESARALAELLIRLNLEAEDG